MADLALIPWKSVEEAPEWAEAPVYKRDEYLAKWEELNISRVNEAGADPAIVERIKSHATQIRNELYPMTKDAAPAVADPVAVAAAAATQAEAGNARKAMFDRLAAAREARKPQLDAYNAELESLPEGFKGSVSAVYPEGSDQPVVTIEKPKFSPEDPPAAVAFGKIYFDPARPKEAIDTAVANMWVSPEDAAEMRESIPQLQAAHAAKLKWEAAAKAAGLNPDKVSLDAAAEAFGVSRGTAGLGGAIAGGALVRALMGRNPYVVAGSVIGSVLGGVGAGKLHDAAADALGDYFQTLAAASTAKGINPEAAARGELAALVLPLPGSVGKLATGAGMVAREAGPMAAAAFAGKELAKGAGIGAATSLAVQGIESALKGENLFNVDSTAFGAALGAVLAGHNLKFSGYSSPQVQDIMQRGLNFAQQASKIKTGQPMPAGVKPLSPREQAVFDKVYQQMRALDPRTDPRSIASEATQVEGVGGVAATEATTTGRIRATQVAAPAAPGAPVTATTITAPAAAQPPAAAAPPAAPATQQAPTPPTPAPTQPAVQPAQAQPAPVVEAPPAQPIPEQTPVPATVETAPATPATPAPPVEATPAAKPAEEPTPAANKYEGAVISSTAIENPDGTWTKGPALNTPHKELIRDHLLAGGSPDTETMLDSMGFEVTLADGTKEWIGREAAYEIAEKNGQLIEPAKNRRLASEILQEVPKAEPPAPPEEAVPETLPATEPEPAPPPAPKPEPPAAKPSEDEGEIETGPGEIIDDAIHTGMYMQGAREVVAVLRPGRMKNGKVTQKAYIVTDADPRPLDEIKAEWEKSQKPAAPAKPERKWDEYSGRPPTITERDARLAELDEAIEKAKGSVRSVKKNNAAIRKATKGVSGRKNIYVRVGDMKMRDADKSAREYLAALEKTRAEVEKIKPVQETPAPIEAKPSETELVPKAETPAEVSAAPPAEINPDTPSPIPSVEPTSTQQVVEPTPSETKPAVKPEKTGGLDKENHRLAVMMDGERERLWRLAEYRNAPDPEDAAQVAIIEVLNSISEADAKDPAKIKAALTTKLGQVVEDQRRRAEAAKRGGKQDDISIDDPDAQQLSGQLDRAREELAEELAKAMEDLPSADRAMVMQVYDGKSLAEIAKQLGISPQAASKKWEKVQTKMAARLEKYRQQEGALLLPGGRLGTHRIPVPAASGPGSAPVFPYDMSKVNRKIMRAWLGKTGALPPEIRELLRKAGLTEQEMKDRFSLLTNDVRAAINTQAGKRETPARQALMDKVSEFLEGRAGVLRGESPRVQETARKLRNSIDEVSEMLVREGAVRGGLANVIVGNHGAWLRTYYAAFDPDANWNLDALRERASRTGPDAAIARKILDDAELHIYRDLTRRSLPNNPENIEPIMRGLTDRTQMEAALFGTGGGTGSANISSFLTKRNIDPEIKALMGEEKNPLLRAEKSGAFLSQAITRHRSQQSLRTIGLQTGAFWLTRRGRYSVQVPSPDPGRSPFRGLWTTPEFAAAMSEAQMYRHDLETAQGFLNKLWSWLVGETKINLVVLNPRSTVANAVGGGIQSIANGLFIPGMGGAGWREGMKLAFDAVFRGNGVIDPTAADRAVRERIRHVHSVALQKGFIDSSVTVGDFERSIGETLALDELDQAQRRIDRAKGAGRGALTGYAGGLVATGSRVGAVASAAAGAVGGAIVGSQRISQVQKTLGRNIIGKPDAFWKVWNLIDNFAQQLERGLPLEEAMEIAADRTRATTPNYDAIPEGLRLVASKIPLVNIFFQFSWELIRNNINNIRIATEDLRDSNPVAKKQGAKRLMGVAMLAGLLYGIYDHQRRKNGWTSEVDRAARRSFLPEWDKKGMILPVKRDGTKVSYVNGRYMAPQLIFAEAARAATEGKDPLDATGNVIGAFLDDFIRSNASLDPATEAITGRRSDTGKPVTSEKGFMGALERFEHFAKRTMAPGFAQEAGKMRMAVTGESAGYGRKYSLEERFQGLAGMRVNTYDFKDQLSFRISDMDREWNEISKRENSELKKIADMKKVSPETYAERVKEIRAKTDRQRGELQLAAITLYGDAFEVGIHPNEIAKAVNDPKTKLPEDLRIPYIARKLRESGKDTSRMTLGELRAMRPAVGGRKVQSTE